MSGNRYIERPSVGSRDVLSYNEQAKANKDIGVTPIPDTVFADISSRRLVGKGNVCRVIDVGTVGPGFIKFGDSTVADTSIATVNDAVHLPANGEIILVATDDYIISDVAFRVEVTVD